MCDGSDRAGRPEGRTAQDLCSLPQQLRVRQSPERLFSHYGDQRSFQRGEFHRHTLVDDARQRGLPTDLFLNPRIQLRLIAEGVILVQAATDQALQASRLTLFHSQEPDPVEGKLPYLFDSRVDDHGIESQVRFEPTSTQAQAYAFAYPQRMLQLDQATPQAYIETNTRSQ